MRHLLRNSIFVIALIVLAIGAIDPTDPNFRLGKDLRGGSTLVYSVQIDRGEDATEVLNSTIEVLKERVDPTGLLEIQMVAQGRDRIEVTMPLPSDEVKALRADFETKLAGLADLAIDPERLDRAMRLAAGEREARLSEMAGGNAEKLERLQEAAWAYDDARQARAAYDEALRIEAMAPEDLAPLEDAVASAELAYEAARDAALREAVSPEDLRRILSLSTEPVFLENEEGEIEPFPSPRERALTAVREAHPDQLEAIDAAVGAWELYESQRTSLDDPEDLQRLISAAGVPAFRIAVDPDGAGTENSHPEESRLRSELQEKGPLNVSSRDTRWCKINKIENWYDSVAGLRSMEDAPAAYFASRYGLVVERYAGEYWVLCWDARGKRLTAEDGRWSVARSYITQDQFGRPAVGFEMDARGSNLLGDLTSGNVGNKMAVLLDEEVYTAPNLRASISRSGIIEGDFTQAELEYIVRVLTAGALQAKLSPEPISQNTIAPEFGLDNLRMGRAAGVTALIAVSAFMLFYYLGYGLVAVLGLLYNAMLILAAMSLARAAFTLPGIAGVILTFGMAVDANVLIYERIREELRAGQDLRLSVRLGYQKALSSIVDGNVTNLIVCFVLANLGTQEIKGFAITLGIGVVSTLFTALVVSRLLLAWTVDGIKVKKMAMLPTVVPVIEHFLEPRFDWMKARWVFVLLSTVMVSIGIGMIIFQGEKMLDTEFRGGTQVTLQLRGATEVEASDAGLPEGSNLVMTRAEALDRVREIAEGLDDQDPLQALRNAEVIPVDPLPDGVTSDRFIIKTYAQDQDAVLESVTLAFSDKLEAKPPLDFVGVDRAALAEAPVYPVLTPRLGENIDRPEFRGDARAFLGGVAVLLEDLRPMPTLAGLEERIDQMRGKPDFSDTLGRRVEIRVLEGTDDAIETAVILIADEGLGFFDNEDLWRAEMASREWEIIRRALSQTTTLASVQSFSAVIAETFQQRAIVSVVLSLLLILIYIWVRFGSVRYSTAAIITLTHDVLWAIGLIALAEIVYEHEVTEPIARSLMVLPFKIDLNLVAALLTIIGYSLNDTIVIMDRIRENRGKLPYATREVINLSINQTISRTVITSGTTLVATLILYIFGGEGVRAFAYALLVGVVVGTYSSIAVASPLVWSKRARTFEHPPEAETDASRLP